MKLLKLISNLDNCSLYQATFFAAHWLVVLLWKKFYWLHFATVLPLEIPARLWTRTPIRLVIIVARETVLVSTLILGSDSYFFNTIVRHGIVYLAAESFRKELFYYYVQQWIFNAIMKWPPFLYTNSTPRLDKYCRESTKIERTLPNKMPNRSQFRSNSSA